MPFFLHNRIAAVAASGVFIFLATGCGGGGAGGGIPSVAQLRTACTSLKGQTIAGVTVTDATRVESTAGVTDAGLCQVSGTRAPFLDIEVVVPDNWSGRLYQQGGGGFDGRIASALTVTNGSVTAVHPAVTQRQAMYTASNGGNRATNPAQAAPAVWIGGSADARASATDYAYQSVGTTVLFAKGIARAVFSRAPTYTYFNGCSNGGREAYEAAQRWPSEYSGIVAGCESMNMAGATTGMLATAAKTGAAQVSPNQYADAYSRATAACDGADGVLDGYLANPQGCTYAPAALLCGQPTASADPALCFSAAQVATLSGLLADVKLAGGTTVYSLLNWTNFAPPSTIPGVPALGITSYGGLGGGFALLATNDPGWLGGPPPAFLPAPNLATFNVDTHYPLFLAGLQTIGADHDRTAIASYVASGGKLLSWSDSGDPLISPNDHVRNFNAMTAAAQAKGLADPRANARMMFVPASTHGAGGNLTEIDWLSAIVNWVENGTPPDQLTYTFSMGTTIRTLPVCEAPKYPRYNGFGNVNSASSYTCTL